MNDVTNISERNNQVDEFEALLLDTFEPANVEIVNYFTENMYAREMRAKAGMWITSKIHKTEFLFTVSKGKLIISMEDGNEIVIEAPFTGISKPYSRRVAYIVEDIVWTTYHERLPNETVDEIEQRIIEPHINELLTDEMRHKISLNAKIL